MNDAFVKNICRIVGHEWYWEKTYFYTQTCNRCGSSQPRNHIFVVEKIEMGNLPIYDKDIE